MDPNSKQRRASRPKVRTGCTTCKLRRVKCDETKPICVNCHRSRRQCAYPAKPTDIFVLHQLAPKSSSRLSVARAPNAFRFITDDESRYFNIFKDRTSETIGGYFNPNLWNRTILQACEADPAVKACVIAIGALDQTMYSNQLGILLTETARGFPVTAQHHQFALKQYSRAINHLRKSLQVEQPDMRTAIIVCLLTVVFEALNGDMQSAIAQVRSGLKLIKSYTPAGMSGIQARLNTADETHEIIQFFDRMDNDSIVTQDSEPVDLNSATLPTTPDDAIAQISIAFDSLQIAKAYFEYLLREFLHWIAYQLAWASKQKDEAKLRAKKVNLTTLFMRQRSTYLQSFESWNRAFRPLFAASMANGTSDRTRASALALELRFQSLNATLGVNHFLGELGYDEITPNFETMVNLAQQLTEYELKTQATNFAVEGPIISSLYTVTLKCRDRKLRRRAISMMELRPRREGVFDSFLQARLARIQMEIEEAGVPEKTVIPEEKRIRAIKTTYDMMEREGQMKYLQMDPKTKGFVHEKVNFTW